MDNESRQNNKRYFSTQSYKTAVSGLQWKDGNHDVSSQYREAGNRQGTNQPIPEIASKYSPIPPGHNHRQHKHFEGRYNRLGDSQASNFITALRRGSGKRKDQKYIKSYGKKRNKKGSFGIFMGVK